MSRLRIRVTEVLMVLLCNPHKGASKMVCFRTILEYLPRISRERLRSNTGDRGVLGALRALRSA